jgi:hypothetical protein
MEENKSTMKKFWMIARISGADHDGLSIVNGAHAPKYTWSTFDAAKNESERLAKMNAGACFVVLEATHEIKTEAPPVACKVIEGIPFRGV